MTGTTSRTTERLVICALGIMGIWVGFNIAADHVRGAWLTVLLVATELPIVAYITVVVVILWRTRRRP